MSRIGKRPIPLPKKVTVDIKGQHIAVKGPKGSLEFELPSKVTVNQEEETILVKRDDDSRTARERHGL
ncbi:MAG: 50S ribosomal protein L6, partial [Crocosphaera sp.]|nr:50S ribosomal protein L6 [Crocosphaera sp.]